MRSLLYALKVLFIVLLTLILLLSATLIFLPMAERKPSEALTAEPWMSSLSDNVSLGSLVIPGAHDAAASQAKLAFFSRCQYYGIYDLLQTGIRYLDIRLAVASPDSMYLCHGFCECRTGPFFWSETLTLDSVLEDCYRFLRENPSETILFAVKQEYGDETVAEFESCLDKILSGNEDAWLLTDRIPTLGEARGKLVLLRRYSDDASLGLRSGIDLRWEKQNGYSDPSLSAARETPAEESYLIQDRYEYTVEEKWAAFLAADEQFSSEASALINFLSTKGHISQDHPYRFASSLNRTLSDYLSEGNDLQGWIILDFASRDLVRQVYSLNR